MARHYFHLTNGEDFVVDREGATVRAKADLFRRAHAAAARLMQGLPRYAGWSDWLVCVHDAAGCQIAVVPFLGASERVAPSRIRVAHRASSAGWRTGAATPHACA